MKKCEIYLSNCIGKVREKNQDNYFCNGHYRNDIKQNNDYCALETDLQVANVIAVFDGMGGEQNGELASLTAAKSLDKLWNENISLEDLIYKINQSVCRQSQRLKCYMGSTVVIARIENGQLIVANVGDSRAYLFSKGVLNQLTVDHTEEARQLRLNQLMGMDRPISKNLSNALIQHLGIPEDEFILEPHICVSDIKSGDIIMLCSDGLTHLVEDKSIGEILSKKITLKDKNDQLYEAAMNNGGTDNITIALIEIL